MDNQIYLPVNEERTPLSRVSKTSNSDQGFSAYAARLSINVLKERRFQKGMEELLEAHQREKDNTRKSPRRATVRRSDGLGTHFRLLKRSGLAQYLQCQK